MQQQLSDRDELCFARGVWARLTSTFVAFDMVVSACEGIAKLL